ncbi:putative glycolipid-binding domain-containing protein [Curtobacterium sp. BRD11]|uniref:putative glycolipid-binding domain-containing protein n=1 Tax=Curtobacterium sp. BRD11 TaxID=2962581 RepID=UPI0037C09E6A
MTKPHYSWQSAEGNRVDHAIPQMKADGMRAIGTATAADYVLAWNLDASDRWLTRELRVQVESFDWSRSLTLQRHASGAWSSAVSATGSPDLPAANVLEDVPRPAVHGRLAGAPVAEVVVIKPV